MKRIISICICFVSLVSYSQQTPQRNVYGYNKYSTDLLKIMGKEDILIDKKYSDHINIKPIPLFILSNEEFKDKNPSIDEALKNRMYMIKFINEVLGGDMNFSELLKNEEPNIIIFANKLFFKLKMGNRMGPKVPNDDIIKKIEHK